MFPYSFALVFSRAALKFATWNLQNGSTVGQLEQLMGSRSLAGTIYTQAKMRSFNFVSFAFVALWCLSPLGSQALLRVLSTTDIPIQNSTTNFTYINTRLPKWTAKVYGEAVYGYGVDLFPGAGALLGASLVAPLSVKNSPADLWGNVKIPFQSHLSGTTDADGWIDVNTSITTLDYSSLFGIPMASTAFYDNSSSTFNLESTYLELGCTSSTTYKYKYTANEKFNRESDDLISTNGPYVSYKNLSLMPYGGNASQTDKEYWVSNAEYWDHWAIGYKGSSALELIPRRGYLNYSMAAAVDGLSLERLGPDFQTGELLFQSLMTFDNFTNIFCVPAQIYVESQVLCTAKGGSTKCAVIKQRESKLPHFPSNVSLLAFPEIMSLIGKFLPNATATETLSGVDLLANYIYNQDPTFVQTTSKVSLHQISLSQFGSAFSQILNAFLYTTGYEMSEFLTGGRFHTYKIEKFNSSEIRTTPWPYNAETTVKDGIAAYKWALTVIGNTTFTSPSLSYKISRAWAAIFFLSSFAMLAMALVSITYRRKTKIPDYLGYVSSLVQESRHATGVTGGVNLDGFERARELKDQKIRYGDINFGDDVGVLAIGDEEVVQKIEKGRLYTANPQ